MSAPLHCTHFSVPTKLPLHLIKIDVEGAESRVISGLGPVLESGRRDMEVVIEVSTQAFDDILSFFCKHGFFSHRIENDHSAASDIGECEAKRPDRTGGRANGRHSSGSYFFQS